ncbi:hypothetical protein L7F22_007744 [Adiantum nelumboides]|nr:hypothetical protein [Adiantum nelumboides]
MVYQELPINGECAVWVAKAFAFENCQRMDLSLDKSKYRVAWAVVAEDSVTRLGAHKQGLSNKISRVMTHMTKGKIVCKSVLIAQSLKASVDTSNSRDVELAQIMQSYVQAKVRSGGENPCPDIEIGRHAKDAGKDPALPWVIDKMMVGAEGPAPDIIANASLNNEVHVHRVSIDGTVPAPTDASLNSEVPTHCVSVNGSVDGSVPAS